jgi:hypothetical protein
MHVTVIGNRSKPRSVKLELPPVKESVRLLRDPFSAARAASQKSSVRAAKDTNFVVSRDFRKLFLRGAEGELITIPIPNSPNCHTPPNPRVFRPPPGEAIVAVGRLAATRTIAVATLSPDGVIIHELSPRLCTSVRRKQYTWIRKAAFPYNPSWIADANKPAKLGTLFHLGPNEPLLLHDGGKILFRFEAETFCVWHFPVIAPIQQGGILSWMRDGTDPAWVHHHAEPTQLLKLPSGTQDIRNGLGGYLAARISPTTWQVLDAKGEVTHTREIPLDYEVLSVIIDKEPSFFVLDSARTGVFCFDGEKMEPCFKLSSPVRTIHATAASWYIAFVTEDDELCIYSREHKTFVLRMRLGGP